MVGIGGLANEVSPGMRLALPGADRYTTFPIAVYCAGGWEAALPTSSLFTH